MKDRSPAQKDTQHQIHVTMPKTPLKFGPIGMHGYARISSRSYSYSNTTATRIFTEVCINIPKPQLAPSSSSCSYAGGGSRNNRSCSALNRSTSICSDSICRRNSASLSSTAGGLPGSGGTKGEPGEGIVCADWEDCRRRRSATAFSISRTCRESSSRRMVAFLDRALETCVGRALVGAGETRVVGKGAEGAGVVGA